MKRQPNYQKLNFILSVIGFIGSLGFYVGVLEKQYSDNSEKQLIEQLQKENKFLHELLKECDPPSSKTTMNNQNTKQKEDAFIMWTKENLTLGVKRNRPQTEKVAFSLGIEDKTRIKELTEYAVVERARDIATGSGIPKEKYAKIVRLYEDQTNLSFRTSQSILLNQYSTPAPIGYLMGLFCGIQSGTKHAFEPSAGNGLLTIATHPKMVSVNEIDKNRRDNLERQKYFRITAKDASKPFTDYKKSFDAVLTNPPFGSIGRGSNIVIQGYKIYDLDHYMAIHALDTMKDNGRAAIIIGGHLTFDEKGRIKAGKNRIFFNYLYHFYNVADVISIDGHKLYSKQGTSFDVTLILIDGRKAKPEGAAPLRSESSTQPIQSFDTLFKRVEPNFYGLSTKTINKSLRERALTLLNELQKNGSLEGPYTPSSKGKALDTQVPDSMDFELHEALKRITEDVGGDMDNFVRHRLGYRTKDELHEVLAAEQIDVVGMAIYNIEALGQGIIVGDQTGIGKGRVAASMIRYAHLQGKRPIFLTVAVNLFSDIYRDLSAIGSGGLKPFIVNAREGKTDVKDEDGLVIYQAPVAIEQNRVFESGDLSGYDFVMATYSQFNSPGKGGTKRSFLLDAAKDAILIMDESHIASGSSNTGTLMKDVVRETYGAVFLSATFAKRSDNMPIYALKTAISEASMSKENLIEAIEKGGVAMQEILAAQLVAEGQMVRRERTYEGIEVNYMTLDKYAAEHSAIADNITSILRDIIQFQEIYVDRRVEEMDEMVAESGAEVKERAGTHKAGVDNSPYFSKVFNVINQMLFSIKAEAVAHRAIERLKEGKKPVIAFSSTMGSFLEQLEDETGTPVVLGESVNADFAVVLEKGLEGVLRYTITEPDGSKTHLTFDLDELGSRAKEEYQRIHDQIHQVSTGISISPIDVIIGMIEKEGYSVAEVTGRKLKLDIKGSRGIVGLRKRLNTTDAFRKFNNNEVDVLLINQSGSTGASAHAIATNKVSASQVKQRVMIVLQPELDINIEIQKRGRINRTGQILKPIYDYVNSAIPAEKRLMMMLQKKLKSLDANTSSNQKQSSQILNVPDFLNKYGDIIVVSHLKENPDLNKLLGDPVNILGSKKSQKEDEILKEDAAMKVSGRVAVLSVKMQEDFYTEITERYDNLVNYLKQTGEYDLEVEEMDLKAKTINTKVLIMGRGGNTSFGDDSYLETIEANILRKPYKTEELKNIIQQSLNRKTADQVRQEILDEFSKFNSQYHQKETASIVAQFEKLRTEVENETKIKNLKKKQPELVYDAIQLRLGEIDHDERAKLAEFNSLFQRKTDQLKRYFNYFTVGKQLTYPEVSFDGETVNNLAVFLGFKIDHKRPNPYAPSSIGLRFAIASSQKHLELPASYGVQINAIIGASSHIADKGIEHTLYVWGDAIYSAGKDRHIRYVVTGNILQAFSKYKGKLVSYSTIDGKTNKGILLPEYWDVDKAVGDQIDIPISKALNLFKSLKVNGEISASHGITFFRLHENMYRMIVNGSIRDGGEVFLNNNVIQLTFNHNFEKVGKNMSAHIEASDLPQMLEVLEDDIGVSVKMTENEVSNVGLTEKRVKPRVKITPPSQEEAKDERVRRLRLRAKALEIELQLLKLKNRAS